MINIVKGHKIDDVKNYVLKFIDEFKFDLSCKNIVVVPDRYSLIVEKSIFEQLGISSTFNIDVRGINRIAKELIMECNLDCVFVDSIASDFLLYRAIQNVKKDFLCFSKTISTGLVEKIKEGLSLVMSNNIDAQTLKQSANGQSESMQKKISDLSIILEEYTRLLGGRLDASGVLQVFSTLITNTNKYQNTNFYFCGFDSFTKQGYEVVKNISKVAKNTTIGIIVPSKNKNSFIFDDEMLNVFASYFKEQNLNYKIFEAPLCLDLSQKCIFDNVYGYNQKPNQNICCDIWELPSQKDEIEFVAKQILKLTKNNNRFKDISIATTPKYFDALEKTFNKYEISCYIDTQKTIEQTPIFNLISCVLNMCAFGYEKELLIEFVNNVFVDIDFDIKNDIENFIIENNIEYNKVKKLQEQFCIKEINDLFEFCESVEQKQNACYYVQKIEKFLQIYNIKEKIEDFCLHFQNTGKNLLQKTYLQLFDKIEDLNKKIIEHIGGEQISIVDFLDLYTKTLSKIKISSVPLSVDSIFVGDISKSFFEKSKYLIVVGANQDMPMQIKDVGLITDKDIESLKNSMSITPTAKIINKRNKFKLFDTLTQGENLLVTYSILDSEGKKTMPSNFVLDLLILCNNNKCVKEDLNQDLLFNNPLVEFAKENITQSCQGVLIKNALQNLGEDLVLSATNRDCVQNGKNMIKENVSVSQIENYYTCPFKHFVNYGLKLKQRKDGKVKPNDFGNFLHEFCKIFADQNKNILGKMSDEQIEKSVDKICYLLLAKKEYKILSESENDFVLKILKKEMLRFAQFVNYEQGVTNFKISKTEYRFDKDNAIKVQVQNDQYSIIGIVDRIDICDNYFRIIDYKTGSLASSNSSIANLYYGTKIQVYVYLKAMSNILGKNAFGAFYLPLSNSFTDENVDDYKLHGYFLNDILLAQKADNNLNEDNLKSKLFEATITKDFSKFNANSSKNISKTQLESMVNYSVMAVERAIKEILEGNTAVSPLKDSCRFCEMKDICAKQGDFIERVKDKDITPEFFAPKEEK